MEQHFDYVSFNKAGREERNKQLAGGLKIYFFLATSLHGRVDLLATSLRGRLALTMHHAAIDDTPDSERRIDEI
jgi:hypothetical protein